MNETKQLPKTKVTLQRHGLELHFDALPTGFGLCTLMTPDVAPQLCSSLTQSQCAQQ